MNNHQNHSMSYISRRLDDAARAHYESYKDKFSSLEQFRRGLGDCYRLVAWHVGMQWRKYYGDTIKESDDWIREIRSLTPRQIHSKDFGKVLPNYRDMNGKCRRQPYGACLDTLNANHIIYSSESYSNGKDGPFTKCYGLENDFFANVLSDLFSCKDNERPHRIFSAIEGCYPPNLLKGKIKDAQRLYASLEPVKGISCVLPAGWESQCTDEASFSFNPNLTIEKLLLGLDHFRKQKDPTNHYGRTYDWFTLCPSAFRRHLFIDGKPYREIIDCPSGIFWMLAIAGYKTQKIPEQEVLRLIDQCFGGCFYTDIAGVPQKTVTLKKAFMKSVNASPRDFRFACKDPLVCKVSRAIGNQYPAFWSWIEEMRRVHRDAFGEENHRASTLIEQEVMTSLSRHFEEMGYAHLRRVHDALWGVQEIPGAREFLHQIARDYIRPAL